MGMMTRNAPLYSRDERQARLRTPRRGSFEDNLWPYLPILTLVPIRRIAEICRKSPNCRRDGHGCLAASIFPPPRCRLVSIVAAVQFADAILHRPLRWF